MAQKTYWCFTIFEKWDPTIIDWENLGVRYVICQQELSPSTKKLHWQGYIQFLRNKRMGAVKTVLGVSSVHLESAKGTPDDNETYCSKAETRAPGTETFRWGKMCGGQGKRTDMVNLALDIKSGFSEKEIGDKYPSQYMRYHNGINKLIQLNSNPRHTMPECFVYWGETGTGKSRRSLWEAKSKMTPSQRLVWWQHVYYKGPGKWWDGYVGQTCVIIDDYDSRDAYLNKNYMLKLIDRYPFRVETKGSSCWFNSPFVWFTTNDYCGDENPFNFGPAFARRIKEKLEFKKEDNWKPPFEWEDVKVIETPEIVIDEEEEDNYEDDREVDSLFNEEDENHVNLENYLNEGGAFF